MLQTLKSLQQKQLMFPTSWTDGTDGGMESWDVDLLSYNFAQCKVVIIKIHHIKHEIKSDEPQFTVSVQVYTDLRFYILGEVDQKTDTTTTPGTSHCAAEFN